MTLLLPVDPPAGGESFEAAGCGGGAPRTMGLTAGGRMLGLACRETCEADHTIFGQPAIRSANLLGEHYVSLSAWL